MKVSHSETLSKHKLLAVFVNPGIDRADETQGP